MLKKNFTITYLAALTIGLLGLWLLSVATDSTDLRFWFSLIVIIAAPIILWMVYPRDVHPSLEEKVAAWQRLKAKGRRRYVLGQVLLGQLVWIPLICFGLIDSGIGGVWRSMLHFPVWWILFAALGTPLAFVYSMIWWYRQERKYDSPR